MLERKLFLYVACFKPGSAWYRNCVKHFCSDGSVQRDYRSSGSCTSPVRADSNRREGITEPLDSRDQSLSVTRFKKPVEKQKRSCMNKCLGRKGAPGSCIFFYRASLRVSFCQGHPVPRKVPELGNSLPAPRRILRKKDQPS